MAPTALSETDPMRRAASVGVLVLATVRIVRLVTTDKLPEQLVIRHVRDWRDRREVEVREQMSEVIRRSEARAAHSPQQCDAIRQVNVKWAQRIDSTEPLTVAGLIVEGLDCPFCVGFWIGGAVLVGEAVTRRAPSPVRAAWRLLTGALALNYVTGHLSSRLD
jgi:hypothetical protein